MSGSAENKARTARGRPWPKGTSGNPGGRPRGWGEFRDLMRSQGAPVAFEVLLAAMQGKHPLARIRAAQLVLAYAWGYPAQVQPGLEGQPGLPRGIAGHEGPSGPFTLNLVVVDPPKRSASLPGDGTEGNEDSDSLPPPGATPS